MAQARLVQSAVEMRKRGCVSQSQYFNTLERRQFLEAHMAKLQNVTGTDEVATMMEKFDAQQQVSQDLRESMDQKRAEVRLASCVRVE